MTIYDLKPGQTALIDSVLGNDRLVKRLQALGCVEGSKITLKYAAPLGDPLVLSLKGTTLALRKKDAKNISITLNSGEETNYDKCCISG